jgi:hypothetical protein
MNRNGATKIDSPIRLSPQQAARQLGVRATHIKNGLIRQQIGPGADGKFSVREIFTALNNLSELEREAKRARFQAKIDQAEYQRLRLEEKQGVLVHIDVALAQFRDIAAIFFGGIRHSSMPKAEQKQLIDQMGQAIHRKLAPSGTRESDAIIRRQNARREAEEYEKQMKPIWEKERREREERKREEDAKYRQKMEKARREWEAAGNVWGGTIATASENGRVQ